jgi:hypothetical protein
MQPAWMEIRYCARRRLSVISARAWVFDTKRLRPLIRRKSRITEAAGLYRSVFCSHLVIARLADENFNAVEKIIRKNRRRERVYINQSLIGRSLIESCSLPLALPTRRPV